MRYCPLPRASPRCMWMMATSRFSAGAATSSSPSSYGDREELVAAPALDLDVALIHMHRGDARGNGQYLNVDPYMDNLVALAAPRCFMSVERIVDTDELASNGPVQTQLISRLMTHGVVEAPKGAHFTECVPDYPRDEAFQREYAASAKSDEAWNEFRARYIDVTEAEYQAAIDKAPVA